MSQTQHTAPSSTAKDDTQPARVVQMVIRVPESLKWDLAEVAARKRASVSELAVQLFAECVAREKVA